MGFGTVGAVILIVIFAAIIVVSSWIIYVHLRARRLGLPPPTFSSYNPFAQPSSYSGPRPAPGGIVGWVNDRIRAFKNRNRVAGGAYEEPLSSNVRGRGANRGFGALDPDDAWDARVGTEADAYGPGGYEEQELGLTGGDTAYGGAGSAATERGRAISREPEPYVGGSKAGMDRRYDEEMGKRPSHNPFDDDHAEASNISLRGVSPRPIDTSSSEPGKGKKKDTGGDSPTERRSMFQEQM
jgi:hypothetical protein